MINNLSKKLTYNLLPSSHKNYSISKKRKFHGYFEKEKFILNKEIYFQRGEIFPSKKKNKNHIFLKIPKGYLKCFHQMPNV